jgi:hypothetical protein
VNVLALFFETSGLSEAANTKEGLIIVATGVAGSNEASPGPVRRFVQAPGYVAVAYEETNASGLEQETYRVIPLDKRPVPGTKSWMGTSRGHWDGDALVVVTTNVFYNTPILSTYGHAGQYLGTGETLTVTERFKRVDADTLEYRYTVDDPKIYLRPYTVLQTLSHDDNFKINPAMCQENNFRNLSGQLAQGRADQNLSGEYAADSARLRQERMEELKAQWAEAWAKQGRSR